MATSTSERDTHLLSVGKQCSLQTCMLVDFLPFKCQHCSKSYCGEHFKVEAHKCPEYDESKYDRVAPNCPLCNEPVAVPPNQDPNIRMEQHLTRDCSVMTGRTGKKKSGPACARTKCGKTLFAPIQCNQCKQQFCPSHRFPADHSCTAPPNSSTSNTGGNTLGSSPGRSLADLYANAKKSTAVKAAFASAPSLGSNKNVSSSRSPIATTSSKSKATPAPSESKSTARIPFSKQDRSTSMAPLANTIVAPSLISTDSTSNSNDALTITTNSPSTHDSNNDNKPPRIIDPMSFVPRSVFSMA
ncbi:hypothetical protein BDN71DRAFT_1456208 [Pleurotus eryngii]|uniref:AN1-type domain-containing protein n=1 Tax=Pleurotus eryngii TaxID=5323 RepID=A0A9P5ZP95_PLEER|nr:hypothetical protein BDN71DRAFT_1456208 [Pleurotus eryngii]